MNLLFSRIFSGGLASIGLCLSIILLSTGAVRYFQMRDVVHQYEREKKIWQQAFEKHQKQLVEDAATKEAFEQRVKALENELTQSATKENTCLDAALVERVRGLWFDRSSTSSSR